MIVRFASYILPDSWANNVDAWMPWFDVTHADAALLARHCIDHQGEAGEPCKAEGIDFSGTTVRGSPGFLSQYLREPPPHH